MVNSRQIKEGTIAARERILEAAIREFAERGFDGARVDEIATRAHVNKALIYYYYDSKQTLLDSIFEATIEDFMSRFGADVSDTRFFEDERAAVAMMERLLDCLEDYKDVIRIVLMETLKGSPANVRILGLVAGLLDRLFVLIDAKMTPPANMERARVMEFFTGFIPLLSYVVYHEMWTTSFGMDEAQLRAEFIRSFIDAHFTATERLYSRKP